MKRFYSLILLCVTAVGSFLLCTKNPSSTTPDDMRDELKPRGSISGFVYDKKGNPLKDVLIDVDSGKGTPDITEANGHFTISEVIDSCVLRFIHRDYEDNPVKVSIKTGIDTILRDTICLTCSWYTIKGVVKSSNGVQIGAGVAVSGYITSTLTGIGGTFVLKQIPKRDTVTLICSKAGAGAAIISINNCKDNDTTDAGEILLNDKESATVSGIVYSKDNIPLSGVAVSAVGGGTHAITDVNGYYKLQDIPVGTDGIIIKAGQTGVEGMIGGIKASNGGNITGCNIVMSETTEMTYGMKLHTKNVYVDASSSTVVLSVYPETEISTKIVSYTWTIDNRKIITVLPVCTLTTISLSAISQITVEATNTDNKSVTSIPVAFYIQDSSPVIDSIGVSGDKKEYTRQLTITEGEWAFVFVSVRALFGGLSSMTWNFGDSTEWTSPDSNPMVGHLYTAAGTYVARFTAIDTEKKRVTDSVSITVVKPLLTKPALVWPDSGQFVELPADSLLLVWRKVPDSTTFYNVYLDASTTVPSEQNLVLSGLKDTSAYVRVKNSSSYYWRVKAIRKSDSATVWSDVSAFRVETNKKSLPPVFTSIAQQMTDTMLLSREYRDTLRATDPNGDLLTFYFSDSVKGMIISDSILTYTPSRSDNGIRPVKIYVKNQTGLKDSLSWSVYINILAALASPVYLSPTDKAINSTLIDSITLRWEFQGDSGIVYDVYWDTHTLPVALVKKSMKETSLTVPVDSGCTYYWKVKATRLFDSTTAEGPVWTFTGRNFGQNTGLIAEWNFEGNANDVTGNGYDAILTDGDYVAGRMGAGSKAFRSAYASSSIIENSRGSSDSVVSISLWVRPESFSGGDILTVNFGTFRIYLNGTSLSIFINSSSITSAVSSGEWCNIALTNSGGYIRTYINGKEEGKLFSGTSSILCTLDSFSFAVFGCLDDMRFYNRPLSAEEIRTNFENWKELNHVPVFGAAPNTDTLIVGRVYEDTLVATDADGDMLQYSLTAGPGVSKLHSNIERFIPEHTSIGVQNFQALVTDGRGGKDTLLWKKVVVNTFFTDSLIAYYPFNCNYRDWSGNGYDASGFDMWYPDRYGRDSSAQYISNGSNIAILKNTEVTEKYYSSNSTTFAAWVQPHTGANCGVYYSSIDELTINTDGRLTFKGSWLPNDSISSSSLIEFTLDGPVINQIQWNHIVSVVTSDSVHLYVNGNPAGKRLIGEGLKKQLPTDPGIGSTRELHIGGRYPILSVRLVNDVRLYNRALSAEEVKGLFEFERP